jgi:16S rRNA (adenine1518-N6/adenine1519-N6)-dimethyltransferase
LGQNFLQSPALAAEIIRRAKVTPSATVVELGVGLGTLTCALARAFKRVIGFEIDERLLEILEKEKFLPENVELRKGDILRLDYRALARELGEPLTLFGNLPYYLSSRLVFRLLEERAALSLAVFMFQKEVAEPLPRALGAKLTGSSPCCFPYWPRWNGS